MALLINSFAADLNPIRPLLPFLDYPSWQASTEAKEGKFAGCSTWRYELREDEDKGNPNRFRMIFLSGQQLPAGASTQEFDVGRFWRIGTLLIEEAFSAHFKQLSFVIEDSHFEKFALRAVSNSPDDAIELATGVSFSARRPFRDDQYRFALSFKWEVRALFRDTLANADILRIALGMPVLYKPQEGVPAELLHFRNRYLGRVRSIENDGTATVITREDNQPLRVPLADLKLEASPAVIKVYEQRARSRSGPSPIIRTIQQLKRSYTRENRRNVTASKDRLEEIRALLNRAGASLDQLIVPLSSFQAGSVTISLIPMEASFGDTW
jgi:hypothetical protein